MFQYCPSTSACVDNLSHNELARTTATAATAAAEELSQSIHVPSSTQPGTTYPAKVIRHSDITAPIKAQDLNLSVCADSLRDRQKLPRHICLHSSRNKL